MTKRIRYSQKVKERAVRMLLEHQNEYLNTHWFLSLDGARQKIEQWRRDYNRYRHHS